MRVNARGDQLGPGGKIVKTRNQIMKEYYQLNTPVSVPSKPERTVAPTPTVVPVEPVVESKSEIDHEMSEIDEINAEFDDRPKSRTRK
jgi:hypothetical protein